MPTTKTRRLLLGVVLGIGLWFVQAGGASAVTVPTTDPAPSLPSPATTAPTRTPPPPDPDEGFQPEDVREWAEDNVILIIVAVGLVLLVLMWKWISRPPKAHF